MLIAIIGGLIIGGVIIYIAVSGLISRSAILQLITSYFREVRTPYEWIAPYSHRPQKFNKRSRCLDILACKPIDGQGPPNGFSREKSRAIPNRRLIDAFGVDNAFTTTTWKHRSDFVKFAEGKISGMGDGEWKRIADMTLELVRKKTRRLEHTDGAIPLVPFVQSITLSMSLYVWFGLEPLSLKEKTVADIASLINELWITSKVYYPKSFMARKKVELQKALRKIDSTFVFTPERTPLNLILPAYETMWRVVLRCFLEVVFRNDDEAALEWRDVLQAYLGCPTSSRFGESATSPGSISASHVVHEALRLYPPASRVYRTYELGGKRKDFAADIEECHRNDAFWGADGQCFRPSRWTTISEEALTESGAFMSFGAGRFVCPAKKTFGPRMIGVLVASLAAEISTGRWTVGDNEVTRAGFRFPDGPLESGREVYGSLRLWRTFA